jgi:hypothetical protein
MSSDISSILSPLLKFQSAAVITIDVFTNIDIRTEALIFQLKIEDSNELFEPFEGKGKAEKECFQIYKLQFKCIRRT